MESLYETDSAPLDIDHFIWRHKGKMLLTFLVSMAATLAYLSLSPRRFQSEAKLLVRIGRESITLDPTATTGQFVAMAESRESELHGIEELLGSRSLAEKIVDQFGAGVILERRTTSPSLGERLAWLDAYNLNPLKVYSIRDKAIKALQKNLGLTAGKKSNILSVSYKADHPELARDVLD